MNFFSDEKEWKWLFRNAVDWDQIFKLHYPNFPTEEGFESKEEILQFYEELLDQTGGWAGTKLVERAKILDEKGPGEVRDGETIVGPELKATYDDCIEMGLFGITLPKEYGGMELPAVVYSMLFTQMARACVGTSAQVGFFTSVGEMINRFCDKETRDRLIPKIVAGEISGSMCLTEPGCGSDVGAIKTTALKQDDGSYLINGNKIFITNGGGGLGLVLAKVKGAPEGLRGISMFLVEQTIPGKEDLNFRVVKNEEKMGLHSSFTCEVVYENTVGHLVGNENEGFLYMLNLMNAARVGSGGQAVGGIEASLHYARQYAEERKQFGKPISELPLMKRNLEDFETERDAIRAMYMDTVSQFEIWQFLDLKQKRNNGDLTKKEEQQLNDSKMWARKRTPLLKYYGCESFVSLSTKAIQVLGGYGFMKEYPVEKWHRDSFAPLLYEGTSQIQALMALKDMVKYLMSDPKRFVSNFLAGHPRADFIQNKKDPEWERTFKEVNYTFKKKMIKLLVKCMKPAKAQDLMKAEKWQDEEGINKVMEHAETLAQAMSYLETLRVLSKHASQDESRADLYNRYYRLVMPRISGIYIDWEMRT